MIGRRFGDMMRFRVLSMLLVLAFPTASLAADEELDKYQFRETQELIDSVHDAAELFSRKGARAFAEFEKEDSHYLFVIDIHGTPLFDPFNPDLVGKNILSLRDLEGKPIIRQMIDVTTRDPSDPGGWVHYLWLEPGGLLPTWKSSYVLRTTGLDGTDVLIGSGIYNMRTERQFLVETVDAAVDLIREKGTAAFAVFADRSSRFVYKDIYLFVLDMTGHVIVDPASPDLKAFAGEGSGRNLLGFRDAMGRKTIEEMIDALKTTDTAWISYMWPKPGETRPSKKIAYLRRVDVKGTAYIVGSDYFAIDPIWKKF